MVTEKSPKQIFIFTTNRGFIRKAKSNYAIKKRIDVKLNKMYKCCDFSNEQSMAFYIVNTKFCLFMNHQMLYIYILQFSDLQRHLISIMNKEICCGKLATKDRRNPLYSNRKLRVSRVPCEFYSKCIVMKVGSNIGL